AVPPDHPEPDQPARREGRRRGGHASPPRRRGQCRGGRAPALRHPGPPPPPPPRHDQRPDPRRLRIAGGPGGPLRGSPKERVAPAGGGARESKSAFHSDRRLTALARDRTGESPRAGKASLNGFSSAPHLSLIRCCYPGTIAPEEAHLT